VVHRVIVLWKNREQRGTIAKLCAHAQLQRAATLGRRRRLRAASVQWFSWTRAEMQMALWARLGADAKRLRTLRDAWMGWLAAPCRSQAEVMASVWGTHAATLGRAGGCLRRWHDLAARRRVHRRLATSTAKLSRLRWWRWWAWQTGRGRRLVEGAARIWAHVHARRALRRWRSFAGTRAGDEVEEQMMGEVQWGSPWGGGSSWGSPARSAALTPSPPAKPSQARTPSPSRAPPLVALRHADRARAVAFDTWLGAVILWVREVRRQETAAFCAARFRLQRGVLQLARNCVEGKTREMQADLSLEVVTKRALATWATAALTQMPGDERARSRALLALAARFWALRARFITFGRWAVQCRF
jgi:hypothetical protein